MKLHNCVRIPTIKWCRILLFWLKLCTPNSMTDLVILAGSCLQADVQHLARVQFTPVLLMLYLARYRVFINYCVFSFCDFSELCQFSCSAGFLSAWCVYTHWHRGKTEKGPEYFKKLGKNKIFNEHPVPYKPSICTIIT